ncbi:MAG: histidinol-phosphate transaminase [Propionibacteriaceae bacterium]|nr:histidinol-phosphate transaminase [Propionibacteriaceae bacterium]
MTDRLDTPVPLREALVGVSPYGAPEIDDVVRLNVNENPYPPSQTLRTALLEAVGLAVRDINRYPDRDATVLREALAQYLDAGLTAENIWAANGSNEVMTHLLLAFGGPGRTLATLTPTYSMYPQYARDTMTGFVTAPRKPDYSVAVDDVTGLWAKDQPDILVLTTPNNPTGTQTSLDVIDEVCGMAPWLVVVDEAYQEFTADPGESAVTLLPKHRNLVVARTMSKAFALAGVRLGYLAAEPSIVDACRIVRLPYHLGVQTQALALAAVHHADEPLAHVAQLRETCQNTQVWMRSLGLTVPPSQANFALFGPFGDRHAIWAALLAQGVLVREVGPAGYLRVSMGTPDDMVTFREALVEVLDQADDSWRAAQ